MTVMQSLPTIQHIQQTFKNGCSKLIETLRFFPLTGNLIRPHLFSLVFAYCLNMAVTSLGMLKPKYAGNILDIVTQSKDADDLQGLVFNMVIFLMTCQFANRFSNRFSTRAMNKFQYTTKSLIYKSLLRHNMAFFDKISTAEASSVISSGVDTLQNLYFGQLAHLLQTICTLFGSLWLMYTTNVKLTYVVLLIALIKLFMSKSSFSQHEKYKEFGDLFNKLWSLPYQAIQNISLVKSFSTEDKEYQEFVETQEQLDKVQDKQSGGLWDSNTTYNLVEALTSAIIIWYGGIMAFKGIITPGELSMFNVYSSNFTGCFRSLKNTFVNLHKSFMHCEKLLKVLEVGSKEKIRESKGITKANLKGCIDVSSVRFSYPSRPDVEVLKDINLKINAGESVAFVGASGSGKTTMVSLLLGLYETDQGKIVIDSENIQDYDIKWLHRQMGYVSQEPVLLEKSVEQNVGYGLDSYSKEQIEKALEMSNSLFILNKEKFPNGLQTKIGHEGIKLSGGQKQRLAIARAFVKDPKILILDEPTSALDGESESQVQKAIDELVSLGDRTVVVVAHRLSTIINCSKIMVFEDGKIVEEGTHRELIEKNGAYKKLFEFQMNSMKNL